MTEAGSLLLPLLSGTGIALSSAWLGVFVTSQRLAFFSDALAHAALLGISASLLLQLPLNISFIVTALFFAIFFSWLLKRSALSSDTLIGILAHSFLAISLVAISLFHEHHIDLEHYLLGDLLRIDLSQFGWIVLCVVLNLGFLAYYWRDLVMLTLHPDIAAVEGVNTDRLQYMLTALLALLVAASIQLVGALLISALLLIPVATARPWSSSPAQMGVIASLAGMVSVTGGLLMCQNAATPSGPSIVLCASLLMLLSLMLHGLYTRYRMRAIQQ